MLARGDGVRGDAGGDSATIGASSGDVIGDFSFLFFFPMMSDL